jgi:hypothetical protein
MQLALVLLVCAVVAFGGTAALIHGLTTGELPDRGSTARRDKNPVYFAFLAFLYGFMVLFGFVGFFMTLHAIARH